MGNKEVSRALGPVFWSKNVIMRIRRAGAITIGAMLIAVSLTGCDQFLPEPLAFTLVDGRPIVRVCLPLTIGDIEIDKFGVTPTVLPTSTATASQNEVTWRAEGELEIAAGFEFVLGEAPPGYSVVVDALGDDQDLTEGSFSVGIDVEHSVGRSWNASASFENITFVEGVWLDSYGEPIAVPCTRPDCDPGWACHNEWPVPSGDPTRVEPTITPTPIPR